MSQRNPHQGIIRRPRLAFEDGFIMIPNEWARDSRIKPQSLGLLVWLMSHAEGFETGVGQIAKERRVGREAARTMVNDLEHYGYLKRELVRGESGRYEATDWQLCDPFAESRQQLAGLESVTPPAENHSRPVQENPRSEPVTGFPTTGKPSSGKPSSGKPSPVNPTTKEEHLQEEHLPTVLGNQAEVTAREAAPDPGGIITEAEAEAYAAAVATPEPPAYGVQPAPRYPRLADLPNPDEVEHVSPEQRALNAAAEGHPCPRGFGQGRFARHWCPSTGDGCVLCGVESQTILNELEATP